MTLNYNKMNRVANIKILSDVDKTTIVEHNRMWKR